MACFAILTLLFWAMTKDDAHQLGLDERAGSTHARARRPAGWTHDESEHDACAILARVHDIPLHEVMRAARAAYEEPQAGGKAGGGKKS